MMSLPNLVVGLAILALGVILTLQRLGIADATHLFEYWPVLLVLFGAGVALQALRRQDPAGPQQRAILSPGVVLIILVVALFAWPDFRVGGTRERTTAERRIQAFSAMGSSHYTSLAADFEGARLGALMGRSTLDLRQAMIAPGEEAHVDVFTVMGRATILVPPEWEVDTSALPVMGRVSDDRTQTPSFDPSTPDPSGPRPRLLLRGFVMMGRIDIRFDDAPEREERESTDRS